MAETSCSSDLKEAANNFTVNVRPARCIYGGPNHPDIYKNESTPRGIAFIVNIETFENDFYPKRKGSDVDVRNLKELFTQMGYEVEEHHDLTLVNLRDALRRLSEDPRLARMDSLVISVMSHGKGDGRVVTADGRHMEERDISDYFSNQNCPLLRGKPKIFIYQFCRGNMPDIGVCVEQRAPPPVAQHSRVSEDGDSIQKLPTYSDLFIIHSTAHGFVSYRNSNTGSWFIESLCQEFMEHAHNTEMSALASQLSDRVSARQSSQGWVQAPEIRHILFKKFYFNPVHINQLENPQFRRLPYFSELQPSGSGLLPSCSSDLKEAANNFTVNVRPARCIYGGPNHPDIYKNESTPRGIAVIVNMYKFVNDTYKKRIGSNVDVRNLKELFTQMGYVIEEHHDLSESELCEALRRLSEDPRLAGMDSLMIIVMSHGVLNRGESHVVTADNRRMEERDISDYFNNRNCPLLRGKPKIFIYQFCRGDLEDTGVYEEEDVSEDNAVAMDCPTPRKTIHKIGSYSDLFFIYAALHGGVAYRDEEKGSFLIQSLCQEFMENAHNTEFYALVSKVSRSVRARESSRGRKQVVEFRQYGFDKKFYFNPVRINQLQNLPYFSELQPSGNL